MKTSSKDIKTDKVNSQSKNEIILNWRFIFPGNSDVKVSGNKISLKVLNSVSKKTSSVVKELSNYITRTKPDCVLVSGGIDSSLLAAIAKKELGEIKLVSAGTEDSQDLYFSGILAKNLDENLHIAKITEAEVYEAVKCLRLMHLDYYNIIMGITEFIAIKKAAEMGCKRLMSGLGSDELFFGFYKHQKMTGKELADYRDERLFYMPAFDVWRINSIASYFKVSILLPYLNDNMVNLASLKAKKEYNDKILLRSAGRSVGLSKIITERNKKAMQYGSGVVKLLRNLSRKKHEKVGELIKMI